MVSRRDQTSAPDESTEPSSEGTPPRDAENGAESPPGRGGFGSADHARPWRQWSIPSSEVDTAPPLEVSTSKRPQWGRYLYFFILFGLAFFALKLVYDHVLWLNASGAVSGQRYELSPARTVTVASVKVQLTEKVEKGQVLIEFNSPELQQALAQNLTKIAQLKSRIANAGQPPGNSKSIEGIKAKIEALQSQKEVLYQQYIQQTEELVSLRELVAQRAVASANLEEARAEWRQTRADYDQVVAKIRRARSQLERLQRVQGSEGARKRLAALKELRDTLKSREDQLTITAPASGVVADVMVQEGETLRAGDPAAVVVESDSLQTHLYFPPGAADHLRTGQRLPVTLPNGHSVETRITTIYPSVQAMPKEIRPPHSTGNQVSVVAEVEPADKQAATVLREVKTGTPISARVLRWEAPEAVTHLFAKVAGMF